MNRMTLIITALACGTLAACGGGGDRGPGSGTDGANAVSERGGSDVPVSATQDADAAFAFVASVAAGSSDSADPLVTGDATLATTETGDAKPL